MFWALIAPEIVIMWAMRQFYGARRIRDAFRDAGWTLTEGHFLQMGGFVFSSNGNREVLSFSRFKDLLNRRRIQFPEVDRARIEDQSKGDAFSKLVAVFQTSWFIVQCISRAAQHLPLTQLELATVALAAVNALMYAFWWYKPQGVRCPIYVQSTSPPLTDSLVDAPMNGNRSRNAIDSSELQRPDALKGEGEGKRRGLNLLPRVSILRLMHNLVWRIDMGKTVTHVPMLYSIDPDADGDNTRFYQIVITGAAVGTVFGSIHCIAWNFEFPTLIENVLWRASSLVVTVIPILLIITEVIYRLAFSSVKADGRESSMIVDKDTSISPTPQAIMKNVKQRRRKTSSLKSRVYDLLLKICGAIYILLSVTSVFLYIVARIILLTEAAVSLRHLPHTALSAVQWAFSIPHTG